MFFLSERNYSVVAPFVERFFELIDRKRSDRCTFEEFLPAICAFSLFSRQEMIAFIFSMLDTDNDKIVSKIDLLKFISQFRQGLKQKDRCINLYPLNVPRNISDFRFERGDKIDMNEFN